MKIIAVGMNYVAHCHELHADENLPEEPVNFYETGFGSAERQQALFIPDFSQQVDYETELVVRINRFGKEYCSAFCQSVL